MNIKWKDVFTRIRVFFSGLSKKTRVLLGIGAGITAAVLILLAVLSANKPYSVLFTGLSSEDTSAIVTYLEENGVTDYKIENSDTVYVPKSQESKLKAELLMKGYPASGFAYSTYLSNVGLLSTESEKQTAFLFELQDRMGAVIKCLGGVQDAWVNIALGEDNRYVLDSTNLVEATAAVVVQMTGGQQLSSQQAVAIRNLVSHSVSGLDIGNVAISDTFGNTYDTHDSAVSSDASDLKLRLEQQVNNAVRTNVMQVLIPFFGEKNVRVSVNSTVDVSRTSGTSTTYTEPDWAKDGSTNGEGIIGSKIYDNAVTKDAEDTAGGVAGTESNADINTYVERELQPDGTEKVITSSGQIDYNVDTDVQQTERTAGVVADMMVSVSINGKNTDILSDTSLLDHVARAAGISDEQKLSKISILVKPFYEEATATILPSGLSLPSWAIYAAGGGLALFLVLLIVLLSLRSRRKKKQRTLNTLLIQQQQQQAALAGADIMSMQPEKSLELRKNIRDFADKNPEIAAQMVRSWLKGGDENG